jgi:hypothetical protein
LVCAKQWCWQLRGVATFFLVRVPVRDPRFPISFCGIAYGHGHAYGKERGRWRSSRAALLRMAAAAWWRWEEILDAETACGVTSLDFAITIMDESV